MRSMTSRGPPPERTSTDSATSRAFPTLRPRGRDMSVSSATVRTPASAPRSTIVCASSRAISRSFMNVPSAIFLLMIELAMSGMQSTVLVMSRRAYSFLSAGASPAPAAQMTAPTSSRICIIRSLLRSACQPGMASSLSSVPPVWPRPRPESCGTATP